MKDIATWLMWTLSATAFLPVQTGRSNRSPSGNSAYLSSEATSIEPRFYSRRPSKRAIQDDFTPHNPPFRWTAFGDSYTAGPGAGTLDPSNSGRCARCNGSYVRQLANDWPYTGSNNFTFEACSGAVTADVINDQIPTIPADYPPDLVVLTIGGNDVLFGKIIKSCLVNLIGSGNCDDIINEYIHRPLVRLILSNISLRAEETIRSDAFRSKLIKIYDDIFAKMPKSFQYQIIQLGYSRFFNSDDDSTWCNSQTFGKYPFTVPLSKPKLTLKLRRRLNLMVTTFNLALWNNLVVYVREKLAQDGAKDEGWLISRTFFGYLDGDHDLNFNGHRFCEPGVEDPSFNDPSTWFFGVWGKQKDTVVTASYFSTYDASTCTTDPKYEADVAYAWECDMAIYYASPDADTTAQTITGSDFLRGFHPKTVGFTNIKKYLSKKILEVRVVPDIDACVPAPLPQLDTPNITSAGFPASLCRGSSGYTTALSSTLSTTAPPSSSPSLVTYACSTTSNQLYVKQ